MKTLKLPIILLLLALMVVAIIGVRPTVAQVPTIPMIGFPDGSPYLGDKSDQTGKFINVTNGITHRRWLLKCNPKLSELITEKIGDGWIKNLDELRGLEALAEQQNFQNEWQQIKRENKQ